MNWVGLQNGVTEAQCYETLPYALDDPRFAGDLQTFTLGRYITHLLAHFPETLAENTARRTLDALDISCPAQANERAVKTIEGTATLTRLMFGALHGLHDRDRLEKPLTFPTSDLQSIVNSLNGFMGHEASRAFRVTLYRDVAALYPEEDVAYYRNGVGEVLRVTESIATKCGATPSIHPVFERAADGGFYRTSIHETFLSAGRVAFNTLAGTPVIAQESVHAMRDAYARVMVMRHAAEAPNSVFWTDEKGLDICAVLYGAVAGIVAYGFDRQRPKVTFSAGVNSLTDAIEKQIYEATLPLLADKAQAYRALMPEVTAEQYADAFAHGLRHDSSVGKLWTSDEAVRGYVVNLLNPYFKGTALKTTFDPGSIRPS